MLTMDVNGTSVCIGANSGIEWQDVKTFPCSTNQQNLWRLDSKGRMMSSRFPRHCLSPSGMVDGVYRQIRLESCRGTARYQSWLLTSRGEIRFGGSSHNIQVKQNSMYENLYLGPRKQQNEVGYDKWKKIPLVEAQPLYKVSVTSSVCRHENNKNNCESVLKVSEEERMLECSRYRSMGDCVVSEKNWQSVIKTFF